MSPRQTAAVSAADVVLLVVAGVGAGLSGSTAGLASLFSYPALLAVGLDPVTANVTNSVALIFSTIGAVAGSGPELTGQAQRVRPLALAGLAGGIVGAVLLLSTPSEAFEKIVPFLIAGASIAILARRPLVTAAEHEHRRHDRRVLFAGTALIGVYGGYFGAGGGVMMLALFLWAMADPLPRANAFKNVVLGTANGVAAVLFVFFGDVRWSAVIPLGAGVLVGGRLGPIVVRRVPPTPLRIVIALAGLGLAIKLAVDAY
jgi:uncharacterized membrane protein YfcA